MSKPSFIRAVIIGNLTNDFLITIDGKAHNNVPGGPLLYSASGARMWNDEIGLIGHVSADYPERYINHAESRGFEIRGITRDSRIFESRRFLAWRDEESVDIDNPVAHYAHIGSTFPHELLGYHLEDIPTDDQIWRSIYSGIKNNLPAEFLNITGILLSPLDFTTQTKMVNWVESSSANTLMVSPSDQYMLPEYLDKLPVILKGATTFFPTENQLINLCHLRTKDLWEMMELIIDCGCQSVIVSCGKKGYCMFDSATKKKFRLPSYPTRWVDPTGARDIFAGAFLGEFKKTYDLSQALLHACISTSLSVEGTGPYYCLDSLPGLAEARIEKMKPLLTVN